MVCHKLLPIIALLCCHGLGSAQPAYQQSTIDSLEQILWVSGQLRLDTAWRPWLQRFRPPLTEKIPLVQQEIPLNNKAPLRFQANPETLDTLLFSIQNRGRLPIRQVRILAGDVEVFKHTRITRNKPLEGFLVANAGGSYTLEINHHAPLPTTVSVSLKLAKRQKMIIREEKQDTAWTEQQQTLIIRDTIATIFHDQPYQLHPRRDITQLPYLKILWQLPDMDNVIGWAYWVGVGKSTLQAYDNLRNTLAGTEPLLAFAKAGNPLPPHSQQAAEIAFCNHTQFLKAIRNLPFSASALAKTSKGKPHYGYVNGGNILNSAEPVFLMIKNTSDLYDYPVLVKGIVLSTETKETTTTIQQPVFLPYIQLSLQ
jgi:hypothetical protein